MAGTGRMLTDRADARMQERRAEHAPVGPELDPLLEARGLWKSSPGVQALRDVGITIRRGEVHALVGENGAGKSTVMNGLGGVGESGSGGKLGKGKRVR